MKREELTTEAKITIGDEIKLGNYLPDGKTQVPVLPSFEAVGLTAGGEPQPALAWAQLERRGDELWARLDWTLHGTEHFYAMPADLPMGIDYAATVDKGQLERVLFLVARPIGSRIVEATGIAHAVGSAASE